MKANYLIASMAAAALLLASCQREELGGSSLSGEEVSVSISAVMPDDGSAVVKSDTEPGNGSFANRCIMQIYYLPDRESGSADPIPYGDRVTVAVSGMKALFPDQRLVSGHDYRFVFWADHVTANSSAEALAQDLHYDTEEFPIVSFKEEEDGKLSYSSNDDTRDAFFAADVRNISGPSSLSFDLKRPFGQLNIITTDWDAIPDDEDVIKHLRPSKVKLEFSSLSNSIDLVSGKVTGSVNISSEVVPVSLVPGNRDSKQLSFDYIFAKDGEQTVLAEFTMDFLLADGTTQVTDEAYTFTNIPVQRNYQTNVRGNLLTDRTGVEIEVVPEFDGLLPEEVSTSAEIMNVLAEGGFVRLAQDVTLEKITGEGGAETAIGISAGKNVLIDLNGHVLTLNNALAATADATLTLMNGSVYGQGLAQVKFLLQAETEASVVLDDVELTANGAGVGIDQEADGADITIRNSSITALSYAVGTNATTATKNNKVIIENSTLRAYSTVFFDIPSTLEIRNSDITGGNHALILRGGTATVENSTLSIDYWDSAEEAESQFKRDEDWGGGNHLPYAAITAGNRTASGYRYPTSLTMIGCTVQSIGEKAEYFPAMYVYANPEKGMGVTIDYEDCVITGDFEVCSGNVTVNGAAFDAPGQSVSVSDSQTLAEALANMGTAEGQTQHLQVTLSGNIDLSQVAFQDVPAGTSVSMDLSDHTATLPKRNLLTSGDLSLRNGNLSDPSGAGIGCLSGGSVSLDEVQYDAEGWGCIFVTQNAENTNISIKNSTINGGYYAVTSNASANPVASSTIVLENSTFTADESAMMINIPSKITVTGCSFTGGWQAVFLRGGSAEFTDCSINLLMDQSYGDWPERHVKADGMWADGNQAETAAMLIGNRCVEGSASYNYPTSVMLRNTTFSIEGNNGDGGKTTKNTPAVSIWSRVEKDKGATFGYDAATKNSVEAAGTGLVKNNDGKNLTIVEL